MHLANRGNTVKHHIEYQYLHGENPWLCSCLASSLEEQRGLLAWVQEYDGRLQRTRYPYAEFDDSDCTECTVRSGVAWGYLRPIWA